LNELQELMAGWLSGLVMVLPVGYAFGAGMVAAVNPCGFAMLPAYLSLYLGAKEEDDDFAKRSPVARMLRALLVCGGVSLGFILLFGLAGVAISAGGNALLGAMPPLGIFIGGVLILLGLWMLAGRSLYVGVFERLANRAVGDPTTISVRGFFLFGVAYGVASLSCTLPVFLVVVGSGISAGGFLAGAGQFFGYGLGMASVFMGLTLALAFFKQGVVARLRKAVPYVRLASALLLVLAGAYMISYWWSSPIQAALPG
jgi:cytochrome c-type biogenesis protein